MLYKQLDSTHVGPAQPPRSVRWNPWNASVL